MATPVQVPAGIVSDASIQAGAGILASKLQHKYRPLFAQVQGSVAAAERRPVHIVRGTSATINDVRIGPVVAAVGDSTATVDLYKNNASILSAAIVLDSGKAAYTQTSPTLSAAGLVKGDVLEVVVTVSAGTGTLPKGVYLTIDLDEDAA